MLLSLDGCFQLGRWITACLAAFSTPPDLRTNSDSFSPWFPLYCLSFICDAQLVRWLTWLSGFMEWNTGAQVIQKIRSDVLPFLSCLQFVHLWFCGWWRHYCPVLQRKLLGSTYTEHKWSWDNLSYLHHGKMMQCLVGLPGDGLTLPRSELKALGNLAVLNSYTYLLVPTTMLATNLSLSEVGTLYQAVLVANMEGVPSMYSWIPRLRCRCILSVEEGERKG